MIRGVHHSSISTPNLERLLAFYRDLVGIEVLFVTTFDGPEIEAITALPGAKGKVAMLCAANVHIELFEYASPDAAPHVPNRPVNNHGLTHLCFDVVDLPAEYERLKAAGVEFHCGSWRQNHLRQRSGWQRGRVSGNPEPEKPDADGFLRLRVCHPTTVIPA